MLSTWLRAVEPEKVATVHLAATRRDRKLTRVISRYGMSLESSGAHTEQICINVAENKQCCPWCGAELPHMAPKPTFSDREDTDGTYEVYGMELLQSEHQLDE